MKRLILLLLFIASSLLSYAQDTIPAADYALYSAWIGQNVHYKRENTAYIAPKTVPIEFGRQIWFFDTTMSREAAKNYRPDTLLILDPLLRRPEWEALLRRYNQAKPLDSALIDKKQFTTVAVRYWPDEFIREPNRLNTPPGNSPRQDVTALNQQQKYTAVYEPPTHYQLSRVTYADDGKRALFYCSYSCNMQCGEGDLVFMEHVAGKWVVYSVRVIWVA